MHVGGKDLAVVAVLEKWFSENNPQGSCCTEFRVVLDDKRSDFNRWGVLFCLLIVNNCSEQEGWRVSKGGGLFSIIIFSCRPIEPCQM